MKPITGIIKIEYRIFGINVSMDLTLSYTKIKCRPVVQRTKEASLGLNEMSMLQRGPQAVDLTPGERPIERIGALAV